MELNQSSERLRRNFVKGWSRLQMSPRRLSLLGVAGAILIALLYQNSLIAFGIAPILISLLPCVLMCAMGLCMRGCSGSIGLTYHGFRAILNPWQEYTHESRSFQAHLP
jgi:hypothetical protein